VSSTHLKARLALSIAAPRVALLLLPGLLVLYFGFNAGGYFAGDVGLAAVAVALCLILRLTLAEDPLRGFGGWSVIALAGLGGYAVWVLLSQGWSDAPARAMIDFDRALFYVLLFAVFSTLPRLPRRMNVALWGFAAGAVIVCGAALASRVLPDVVSAPTQLENERLSWPLTYWNAMGLLATLALIACFHLAASERQPRLARVLGAASLPLLATTLYFTFSRGAIAAALIGLIAYALLARPRGLPGGLLSAVPAAVAVAVAYGADRLASENPTGPAAAGQASRVALVTALAIVAAGLVRALCLRLDDRVAGLRLRVPGTRRVRLGVPLAALVALIVLLAAVDAPARLRDQYERFVEGSTLRDSDLRQRLTNPGNHGRLDHWRVALEGFGDEPIHGGGAGTYEILWARERPRAFTVINGHSLYMETLAELGIVGGLLLGLGLFGIAAGMARRVRGPDRALYAAPLAMLIAWLANAGVDWSWEMPAVSAWAFAFGGLSLARAAEEPARLAPPGRLARVVMGLLCLLLAATPFLVWRSQRELDVAAAAFKRGDCGQAIDRALAAAEPLPVRPEPFELLAYCDVRLGRPDLAVRVMQTAVGKDPRAWQLRYGLALVLASAGRDPDTPLRDARRLNPREDLVLDAIEAFDTDDPQLLRRRALRARLPIE
jgi:O-Antigen ligase